MSRAHGTMVTVRYFKPLCGIALLSLACGGQAASQQDESSAPAPETLTNSEGREFLRIDKWDPDDLDDLFEAARDEPGVPVTAERLAAQLRGQMAARNAWYVETDPPIELARQILDAEEAPTDPVQVQPQVGRFLYGYDNRNRTGASAAFAFSEFGCSGTAIGAHSMATAAHCVFDSSATEGFFCDNSARGSTGLTGTDSNGVSIRQIGPLVQNCASSRVYARWRFGVNGLSGASNWAGSSDCAITNITTAFVTNIVASDYTQDASVDRHYLLARWDYAAVDFFGCGVFGVPFTPAHVSPQSLTDSQILNATGQSFGYPQYAGCQNAPGAGIVNCPRTVANAQYVNSNGTPNVSSTGPFAGATPWQVQGPDLEPGEFQPAHTIRSPFVSTSTYLLDTSPGNSGGPLLVNGFLVGMASLGAKFNTFLQLNVWHRWNTETDAFMRAHTHYPND